APPGPLAPSEARFAPDAPPTGAVIADVEGCELCHADVAAMWRTSAHAFASFNNPAYRVVVDRFRAETASVGAAASRHCGGCHDVAPLADGLMDHATAKATAPPLEAKDRRARS